LGLGGAYTSWSLILLGRMFNGIGTNVSTVVVTVLTTKWFINDRLNLAYALMAISWGPTTFLCSYITPKLYGTIKDPHLGTAFFASFWINLGCIIFLIPVLVIDKMADNELKKIEEEKLDDIKKILI
jgi:MFS family permease